MTRQAAAPLFWRIGLAIALTAAALAVTPLLQTVFPGGFWLSFLTAVSLSAWYGRRSAGLLTLVLSALAVDFFFLTPEHTFSLDSVVQGVELFIFVVLGLLLLLFTEARRRDQRALQESREQWRAVFDNNPTMYFIIDAGGVVLSVNTFGAEQLGYTIDELVGQNVLKVFHEADKPAALGYVALCLKDPGRSKNWELRKVRKDGTVLWVRETARAMQGTNGGPIVLVACEDITEHKQAEERLRQSEQKFARMIEAVPDSITLSRISDGRWIEVNPGFTRITGYTAEEAVGKTAGELNILVDTAERQRMLSLSPAETRETLFRNKAGEIRDARFAVARVTVGGEECLLAVGDDITERKRSEEELRRSEAFLAQGQRISHTGSWAWNPASGKVIWSEEQYRIFEVEPGQAGASFEIFWERIHPDDRARVRQIVDNAARDKTGIAFEFRIVLPDGSIRYLHSDGQLVAGPSGRKDEYIGAMMDITAHRQALETLQERARLLDLTHDTVFVRDMDDVITFWNRGAVEQYGWTSEDAIGRTSHEINRTVFPAPLDEINAELNRTGRWEGELIHTRRDGTKLTVASRWALQRDERGVPVSILETNNDITERKRAEDKLRESERTLRLMTETIPHLIWSALPDGHVDYSNQRMLEYTDLTIEQMRSAGEPPFHADDVEAFRRAWRGALADGQPFEVEGRLRKVDGDHRWMVVRVQPLTAEDGHIIRWYGTLTDVDDRKRAEETLRRTEADLAHVARVTTMGELTASIAHEVNQPLAAIVTNGNASLRWLAAQPPNLHEAREAVDRIISDGNRASAIVARIRRLLTKTETRKAPVNINEILEDVIALADGEMRRFRVASQTELAADPPPVLADRIQLQQVVLNLMMNGIEAMRTVTDRPRKMVIRSQPHEDGGVLVAFRDYGVGVSPEDLRHVFDAFYTTKPGGLGMGLAISRSIIEGHGGRLWATTKPGDGSTFQFTLPAATVKAPE